MVATARARVRQAIRNARHSIHLRTVWVHLAHGRDFQADYMPTRMTA
jgi:hypothetical protein